MDPPLRVREDWWVFEKSLIKVKGGLEGFRKNLRLKGKTGGFSKEIEKLVGFRKKSKEKHIKAN